MVAMISFKLNYTFISTILIIFILEQYSATNVYAKDDKLPNKHFIAPRENTETGADERCEDECGRNSIGMSSRNFVTDPKRKWPNATIPFTIVKSFSVSEKQLIMEAMKEIENVSCVRFVESPSITLDVLYIVKGSSCSASHQGKYTEILYVRFETCILQKFSMIHEFMHSMGIAHEHQRYDRDDYVKINWDNMLEIEEYNFKKFDNISFTTFGFPYDYDSVMHYSKNAFTKNGNDTITPLKNVNNYKLGQRTHLSKYDVLKINALNDCNKGKVEKKEKEEDEDC